MPELPEVEFARRQLAEWMPKKKIVALEVFDKRILRGASVKSVERALVGEKVLDVTRRGKWLKITLDLQNKLFSHLGMSGHWIERQANAPAERFERVRITLAKGRRKTSVRYLDMRLFGRFVVAKDDVPEWSALGPDPILDGLDLATFANALRSRKRTVKEALLDQSILAGVGNIYVTEALFRARIDPRSRTNALTDAQLRAIAKAVVASLRAGIALTAGDELVYLQEKRTSNPFEIYGRAGKACPRCKKTVLSRIVLGGRTT
ncbi:MAG: DNA-formamidopyrimidine glycosylase family protein, partial [Polyangiaceae bacterium]